MHTECLPGKGLKVLKGLTGLLCRHDFVMAGGTALALQLGHRMSVDLDFFTEKPFSTDEIFRGIKKLNVSAEVMQEEKGTLTVIIDGVKTSFFYLPYPFLQEKKSVFGAAVAGVLDIASMKIIAVCQRGAKRDFIDIYFILKDIPFTKVAENMLGRYGTERINPTHIGKSLLFFNDAEADSEPVYLGKHPDWESVKKFFRKNAKQMVWDLQNVL